MSKASKIDSGLSSASNAVRISSILLTNMALLLLPAPGASTAPLKVNLYCISSLPWSWTGSHMMMAQLLAARCSAISVSAWIAQPSMAIQWRMSKIRALAALGSVSVGDGVVAGWWGVVVEVSEMAVCSSSSS